MFIHLALYFVLSASIWGQDGFPAVLPAYFEGSATHKTIILSRKLDEISGLAITDDGRLFAHDDEQGAIYQLDQKTGEIQKIFYLGKKKGKKEDFEGIAIVGEFFYLVSSEGTLFQFKEGDNKDHVDYRLIKTGLPADLDVEGLCYDPVSRSLLIACKDSPKKGIDQPRSIYSFLLEDMKLIEKPRFVLSPDELYHNYKESLSEKIGRFFLLIDALGVTPSAIERHPVTGSFFILSSRGPFLFELLPDGTVVSRIKLDATLHNQPEGLVFTPENSMIISDEAGEDRARLTIYHPDFNLFPAR